MIKSESEIWKSHPDIPGIEVSTLGRVQTLDRVVSSEIMTRFTKGRILKQYINAYGYMQVNIPVDGKWATKRVNRLVAQTFIDNPENLPQVNHKDCNRTNNNIENLEWCTSSYNAKYREKFGVSQTKISGHPLFAINLETLEVLRFPSQGEASRILRLSQPNINRVIKGNRKQTGGFWFVNADKKYADVIKQNLHDIGETI